MSKHHLLKTRISILASVAVLVIGAGGAAFAFWTSTGTGEGTATSGESVDFTVSSLDATGGPLSPGGPSEEVAFTVTNPASGVQSLSAVEVSIANADGSAWDTVEGCTAEDYTAVIDQAPTFGEIASGDSVDGTVTVSMVNTSSDQNACQGIDVPLYFVAS
jgi:hypothetical protein